MTIQIFFATTDRLTGNTTGYEHVATFTPSVAALTVEDALQLAYTKTQNVFGSWSRGPAFEIGGETVTNEDYSPEIVVIAPLPTRLGRTYGHRSSHIGDVFSLNGVEYRVASFGFERSDDLAVKAAKAYHAIAEAAAIADETEELEAAHEEKFAAAAEATYNADADAYAAADTAAEKASVVARTAEAAAEAARTAAVAANFTAAAAFAEFATAAEANPPMRRRAMQQQKW